MELRSYPQGMFCWSELVTNDAPAAKQFYTSLFGWTYIDNQTPSGVYTMVQKNGLDIGAMYSLGDKPPSWATYVSVDAIDDSLKTVRDLGGELLMGPFDVGDAGRSAFVRDPLGAAFSLWQAKNKPGAVLRDEPGTNCWNELMTTDVDAAATFYKALFDWNLKSSPAYTEIHVGDKPAGGFLKIDADMQNAGMQPMWLPYFQVENCEAAVEAARAAGAQIHVPPHDIPNVGRFSFMSDPQRALFYVLEYTAGK
jgi:predicted enzyme related to lactoylglutathione lyase